MNRSTCYIVHPVPSPQFEFLKEKNNSRNPSPPPSSDLSSLSSNSEQEDLVENQPIAQPNEGQLISSDYWVPIATSRAPKRPKKSTKIRERTAGKTVYLLTATFPKKLFLTMGAHLRNGRNISEEQQRREFELQSKYPISPAAAERLRRIRAQPTTLARLGENVPPTGSDKFESRSITPRRESNGDGPSSSLQRFDAGTSPHRETRVEPSAIHGSTSDSHPYCGKPTNNPSGDTDSRGDSQRKPSADDQLRGVCSPLRTHQVHARPSMALIRESQGSRERAVDEDRFDSSHLHARPIDQSRGSRRDDQTQRGLVRPRGVDFPREFTTRSYEPTRYDAGADTSSTNGNVYSSHPYDESTEPRAHHSPKHPSSDTQNPPTNPRHHIPGSYSLCDSRAVTSTPSAANSTAFYTPGVPESTRRVKTRYAPANIHQPSTSTPLRTSAVPPPAPPSLRPSSPTQWQRPRTRLEACRPNSNNGPNGPVF
ncbi:hypothetical protein PSHT_14214 [Puccinia striiformis]|uniref:Uncharacterized protein n=1 Tax=Puccinia striiformis TaxID=27350 RepID=A0A2S4ULA3_9BASI|nr:hypothetical protein PSHT_14214 [Puccinia striiformis]